MRSSVFLFTRAPKSPRCEAGVNWSKPGLLVRGSAWSFTLFLGVVATGMLVTLSPKVLAGSAAVVSSPYLYNFNQDGSLKEAFPIGESTSPYWWVNSGAYMNASAGRGHTALGSLSVADPWRLLYAANNPTDTDNGYRPQNIFRLVTRSEWQNARQEAYFVINKDNLSASSNRNESNGLLLFNRYQDGDNLYYTGVRVDGSAVIKKKQNGVYTTLAYMKGIYPGTYNRSSNPSLLPKNKWIGLRSEVVNLPGGSVSIKLFLDKGWSGNWQLVAEATDRNSPIVNSGYGGIRTDFMDVTFENFRFRNL